MGFANDIANDMGGAFASSLAGDGYDPNAALKGYASLLGASLVELFHCRYGVAGGAAATSWTGQVAGAVVPAPSGEEMPVAASTVFAGQNTLSSSSSPSKRMYTTADLTTPLLASSSPAYIVSAFRRTTRVNNGSDKALVCWSRAGGSFLPLIEFRDTSADASQIGVVLQNYGPWTIQTPLTDTLPHIIEGWISGSTVNLRLDGGSVQSVSSDNKVAADVVNISFGSLYAGYGRRGDYEHGLHMLCSAYPGDTTAQALRDFIHQDLGF